MPQLEELVQLENAHSGLTFREHPYAADEQAALLRDVLALANAALEGPRFLFVGVRDVVGGQRLITGITPQAWNEFKTRLGSMLGGMIEPPLKVAVRTLHIDDKLVGMLCLMACEDPPYLLGEGADDVLPAGSGWVRRGTLQRPLLRADLQRMFEAKFAGAAPRFDLRIGFPGDVPQGEITLPALSLARLPSAVAAQKLVKMLEAKESAKAMFGRTETRFSRLVHAQVFGVDNPYESHSDESLRMLVAKTPETYHAADAHYSFEERAHKFDLVVTNAGAAALQNVALHLKLARIAGIGIAEQLYGSSGTVPGSTGYPLVKTTARAITVETEVSAVPAGATLRIFREAPRLWARPEAAGKTIPVDVTLHARELREPFRETLILRIVKETD